MPGPSRSLTRLGVFIDGHFFHKLSTYFAYGHPRRARINLRSLLQYFAHVAAREEDVSPAAARVVETHYFRGRLPAERAVQQDILEDERRWDDVLTREGVITHYLPAVSREDDYVEKGIDVWLALEALELTRVKEFDVVVLFSGDRDFVPLLRKLHTIGARTLLPVWEISYNDQHGAPKYLRTSPWLVREATYVHRLMEVIDRTPVGTDAMIDSLFMGSRTANDNAGSVSSDHLEMPLRSPSAPVMAPPVTTGPTVASLYRPRTSQRPSPAPFSAVPRDVPAPEPGDLVLARVTDLKAKFGFAKVARLERDVFFHENFLEDAAFSIALDGQWIEGYLQRRDDGSVQLHEVRVHWDLDEAGVQKWYAENSNDGDDTGAEPEDSTGDEVQEPDPRARVVRSDSETDAATIGEAG